MVMLRSCFLIVNSFNSYKLLLISFLFINFMCDVSGPLLLAITISPLNYHWMNPYYQRFVRSLRCWQCIASNCDSDPSYHPYASQEDCNPGQFCQKVYYEMNSLFEQKTYISTVRSCAKECTPQNDFANCSMERLTTRGCSRRVCCRDKDLCNAALPNYKTGWHTMIAPILSIVVWRLILHHPITNELPRSSLNCRRYSSYPHRTI